MQYACIDIGGTAIKYAMMTEDGQILTKGQVLTQMAKDGSSDIPRKIANIVSELERECGKPEGVAVCSPGLIDAEKGEVIFAGPNFPGYTGMKLQEEIERLKEMPDATFDDITEAEAREVDNLVDNALTELSKWGFVEGRK